MLAQIITGIVGGCAYVLTGLADKDKRENFQWKKMVPTIIIAGVVGGLAGATGQDYGVVANGSAIVGITAIVNKLYNVALKYFSKKKAVA